ncbi:hypothetical protein M4I21_06935 [Cellulophaga sp. 20_2_10]|uniref:hypothetical protein n=1 Tax=Cellulophaga sp. 20_2_10 TaxID=2942476 RepID=UPI00201B1EAF|nr:hypothetical protein [Cellulophaga sp. 20_2_10]MCL5245535.1 hypothetical protein [Cellulophaga sp. 20_2_10]
MKYEIVKYLASKMKRINTNELESRSSKILINAVNLLYLCVFPFLGFGQDNNEGNNSKEIIAHSLNGKELYLDGVVDEEFWLKSFG